MRYQFNPARIRRIAVGCGYTLSAGSETDSPLLVVETPGDGWTVRRSLFGRTLLVKPSSAPAGYHQSVSGVVAGSVTQIGNARGNISIGGQAVESGGTNAEVAIYLPAGYKPDITSL